MLPLAPFDRQNTHGCMNLCFIVNFECFKANVLTINDLKIVSFK